MNILKLIREILIRLEFDLSNDKHLEEEDMKARKRSTGNYEKNISIFRLPRIIPSKKKKNFPLVFSDILN